MTSEAGGVGEIAVEIRVLVEVFKEITDLPCRPEFSAQTLDDVVDGAAHSAVPDPASKKKLAAGISCP
jgi:hypothetical protein